MLSQIEKNMIYISPHDLQHRNDIINNIQEIEILNGFSISPNNIKESTHTFCLKEISLNHIFVERYPWISHVYTAMIHKNMNNVTKNKLSRIERKKIEKISDKELQALYKYCYFLAASVYIHQNKDNKELKSQIYKINNANDLSKIIHRNTIESNINKYLSLFYNFAKQTYNKNNTPITLFSLYSLAQRLIRKDIKHFKIAKNLKKNIKLRDFLNYSNFNPLNEYLGRLFEKEVTYIIKNNPKSFENDFKNYIKRYKKKIKKINSLIIIPIDGEIKITKDCTKCPDLFILINYKYIIAVDIKINPANSCKSRKSQISIYNVKNTINNSNLLKFIFN